MRIVGRRRSACPYERMSNLDILFNAICWQDDSIFTCALCKNGKAIHQKGKRAMVASMANCRISQHPPVNAVNPRCRQEKERMQSVTAKLQAEVDEAQAAASAVERKLHECRQVPFVIPSCAAASRWSLTIYALWSPPAGTGIDSNHIRTGGFSMPWQEHTVCSAWSMLEAIFHWH